MAWQWWGAFSQTLIAVSGVCALAMTLSSNRRAVKWAPLVGLVGQPFWVMAAWTAQQYGMLLLSIAYTVVWAVAAWKEWIRR